MLGGYSSSSSLSSSDSDSDNDEESKGKASLQSTGNASIVESPASIENASQASARYGQERSERRSDEGDDNSMRADAVEDESEKTLPSTVPMESRETTAVAESLSVSLGSPSSEPSTPEEVERVRDASDAHTYLEQARMNAEGKCSAGARKNVANLKRQAEAGRYVHTFLMANRKFHNPKWTEEMFEKFGITEDIQRSTTLPPHRYDPKNVALSERDYWDWRPVSMQPPK
ncbi:conserved hypothetical protein [Perkinsus marinus ATCC 50983]|uniref:Uncharacterized protein n=1 Tax=Perkinsus marinus (strain ATCC 50983 / TXsc) TaxID=423536 RepID=C5M0W3_PERM5|nr:conserved hypothetical protein [Perkinsus marinus ATCC 50983]EEQ97471.1 conserved hypothetical protein [Perkinsus marinus ATCC 50983]|eukprot:XP_002764754.1 conserved hypothetical protein [Perkinsus marinus ATCC 50983]